jgi:hypothetical protein
MHLENGRRSRNGTYARKGTISRTMVPSPPKVSFAQMVTPVPEIMDGSLCLRNLPISTAVLLRIVLT